MVEILHEGKLRFERIYFFLAAVGDSDFFHCEKLPRALVETFKYLDDHKRRTRYNQGRHETERWWSKKRGVGAENAVQQQPCGEPGRAYSATSGSAVCGA